MSFAKPLSQPSLGDAEPSSRLTDGALPSNEVSRSGDGGKYAMDEFVELKDVLAGAIVG
jgi:hypothetical protein